VPGRGKPAWWKLAFTICGVYEDKHVQWMTARLAARGHVLKPERSLNVWSRSARASREARLSPGQAVVILLSAQAAARSDSSGGTLGAGPCGVDLRALRSVDERISEHLADREVSIATMC